MQVHLPRHAARPFPKMQDFTNKLTNALAAN